jgi:septum site-determining protein MinD
LHDVLRGKARLNKTIYPHPLGFKVIPASLSIEDLRNVDVGRLPEVTLNLLGKADFVLLDCAAGLGREAISAISAAQEVIIVTNPDLPAVTDALKTIKVAEEAKVKVIGVVVNRVGRKRHELNKEAIEDILGVPVIAEIPEDRNVPKSITAKQPLVYYAPDSPAAIEIKKLAAWLSGRSYKAPRIGVSGLLNKLVNWLVG